MGEHILETVKRKIVPADAGIKQVQATVNQINKALKDINAECVIGGSFAKSTHLKGDHDVDLFVRFDSQEYGSKDISKILANFLPFKADLVKGSRNYFQFSKGSMDYEVIPVLKVDSDKEAKNVTDMSPLHVDYVNAQTKRRPELNDEIRLAKQFCKANKVYGAESYIQGFSGHVIDLLVIHYGSFNLLIRNAVDWGNRVVVDIERHWSNPLKQLNKSKLQSPLVLIDPLQPDRNAAAALSRDKFELFKAKCKAYLKSSSEEFFKTTSFEFREIQEKAGNNQLVWFQVWPHKSKNDVMGAKLRQVHEYVYDKLVEREWKVIEADWEFHKAKKIDKRKKKNPEDEDHSNHYFIIEKDISPEIERKGPPLNQRENVRNFTKAHKNTYVRNGRLYVKVKRKFTDPVDKIEDILNHKYTLERVKKVVIEEV